ncbi:hypothetical protein D3C73_1167140 [compost metagenome]
MLHRSFTELLPATETPGLGQAEIPDFAYAQLVGRVRQAAIQATRLHLGIDKKRLARATAIILHRAVVITANVAQPIQAVGAQQHPIFEK